ncbi:MAG: hypothetical protein K2Y37_07590 [Pirellulales bacterium]|nr:hypothetical protein [Pirellulales bacterium]
MTRTLALTATIAVAASTSAIADDSYAFAPGFQGFQHGQYVSSYPATYYQPGWYGGWGWGGGYHSSTIAEGYLRGLGDLVQSWGQYNLMTSQGANFAEQARQLALQNDAAAVQTYFHNRRVNTEARRAEAGPRLTAAQVERVNLARTPQRLTARQLSDEGAIAWPAVLEQPQYESLRTKISDSFAKRSSGEPGESATIYRQVQVATQSLKALLRDDMSNLSTGEYLAARKFLDSLAHEARFARTPVAAVAAR